MAILKIARMGHPVLRRPAEFVGDPTAAEIAFLAADMLDTMADAGAIGLAAPQVHVPLRVIVFQVPEARMRAETGSENAEAVPLTVLINPLVEPLGDETTLGYEACLSVPGLIGRAPRAARVHYQGVTPQGKAIDRVAEGFHARVVQHEFDHLDGILYPQRMTDMETLGFVEEFQRHRPAQP